MSHLSSRLVAVSALLATLAAGPATAGGYACCSCAVGCGVVVEVAPPIGGPFVIVDQGPDYTGPGIVVVPGYVEVDTAPATYPYVGRDFYYPPYSYPHHYAKRFRAHHRKHVYK